tara:strand:+ start:477 stop:824 length:348 start_codon:yes stop_codon:yes gene_type:complete
MKPSVNKIITKLNKEKVQLSKLQDIDEAIGRGLYLVQDAFEEAYSEAVEKGILASDILKFDANDAYTEAESLLEDLLLEIKELGIDIPPKVKQLQKELQGLESELKEAQMKLRNI